MDKNPGVTCVVNKTNTIDSTYRNFQMEVLAGENNMVAKVRWKGSVWTRRCETRPLKQAVLGFALVAYFCIM